LATVSKKQAAEALSMISKSGLRSKQHRSYRLAAPHFFAWGLFWLVGYGSTALWPREADYVWMTIVAVWAFGSLTILPRFRSITSSGREGELEHVTARVVVSMGAGILLVIGMMLILHPRGQQIAALVPLLVSIAYIAAGTWGAGPRYSVIGGLLTAITLGSYLWLPAYFLWLMAFAGGGVLILTGVWLRTA